MHRHSDKKVTMILAHCSTLGEALGGVRWPGFLMMMAAASSVLCLNPDFESEPIRRPYHVQQRFGSEELSWMCSFVSRG